MHEQYNQKIAEHYAAYRPSLHQSILKKCLYPKSAFSLGLDIGCGTGQSALALAHFCEKVIGIDTSKDMLQKAKPHAKVTYEHCNGTDLYFSDNCFDVITFAGSLYYAKSQELLNEILRVCTSEARIVIYDFEILLDETLIKLGVVPPSAENINYNHAVNFSGLNERHISLRRTRNEETSIEINAENLAHLLLSDNNHYTLLSHKFGSANLFSKLVSKLSQLAPKETPHLISAQLYFSVYRCAKK
jgi:ubiquinone/menaquinone biosynthesis C-methylase UbiE